MKIIAKTDAVLSTNWRNLNPGQLFEDQCGAIMMVLGNDGHSHGLVHWGCNGPFLGQFEVEKVRVRKLLSYKEVSFSE